MSVIPYMRCLVWRMGMGMYVAMRGEQRQKKVRRLAVAMVLYHIIAGIKINTEWGGGRIRLAVGVCCMTMGHGHNTLQAQCCKGMDMIRRGECGGGQRGEKKRGGAAHPRLADR